MRLARVIGTVVATQKEQTLIPFKLLVIEQIDARTDEATGDTLVVIDTLGAGVGDTVLWVHGGAARVISDVHRQAPLDAAIIGIVDTVDVF
jgi:ethanolamine utilization protein EutN